MPINRGDEFMRLRRKKNTTLSETTDTQEGDKKMTTAVILVFSTMITIGGTLIGFLFGWFGHAYFSNFIESMTQQEEEEEVTFTPHPEMMDEEGNTIPFQVAKLISVEFDPRDAFDSDPFPDD